MTGASSSMSGSYQVELDLTGGDDTFRSVSTVRFQCASPGAASFIELTAPAVREIVLNGDPVSLSAFDGNRIALDGLRTENELRVVADCAYSRSGEGLHRFTDPTDGGIYLYSDLETFDAHRIYACFDQPDLKAAFEFSVTAPEDWLVLSNMAADVAGESVAGGARRWHFPPSPVMSTYITAIVAGPYHQVTSEHDGIPLGIYCRRSLAGYLDPEEIFEVTRQGFDFFHDAFGVRYAFGKYDQVFVPEFKAGAMENAGCVTFLEDYVFRSRVTDFARELRGDTILHEMAHMWFGDLVTMRWWDDLWLNESFADLGLRAGPGRGHPVAHGVDHVLPAAQGLGLPAGPAALHAPDRRGHPRHRRGRGQLRRDHLRQGRVGAQAARRLRGPGSLPGRRAALLRRARLGERHPRRPAGRPAGVLRPGTVRLVEAVAGNGRREHAAAGVQPRRRGPDHGVRGAADRPGEPPGAPRAPDRDRPLRPDRTPG